MSKKVAYAALTAVITMGMHIQSHADQMPNMQGMEKCYGVCKAGKNDCGDAGGACAGHSRIDSDRTAWIALPRGTCHKIVGGSTEPGR